MPARMSEPEDRLPRGREFLLLIASGLLLVLAFPPIGFFPAAFVGLVPLFYVLSRTRGGGLWSAFKPGFISGLAFFFPLLYWLIFLSSREMDNPVLMAGPLLLLVVLQAFYWGLFSAGAIYVNSTRRVPLVLSLPIFWVASEQLRSLFVLGFPWGALGYAGVVTPRAIQFASVTGLFGVSFWMALVNVLVLALLVGDAGVAGRVGVRPRASRPIALAVSIIALLVIPPLHGTLVMRRGVSEQTVRVAVIQSNIEGKRKWDSEFKMMSFDTLAELSRQAAEADPDLIVWPETAAPSYLFHEPIDMELVAATAREAGVPILLGFPDMRKDESGEYAAHNSVMLMSPDGVPGKVYDKIHLVPFGEVIPFETVFPILKKVDFGEADFRPGLERVVFEIPEARFSTLICFESIFPRLVRQFVAGGAELLVNITNDVWYGRTSLAFQHAAMPLMRCIENRRSLVRCANTGVSLFADPYGRVLESTPIFERGFFIQDLPVETATTFYTRHGDVFPWTVCVLAGLLLAFAVSRGREAAPHNGRP